jgi:hypothetical protein
MIKSKITIMKKIVFVALLFMSTASFSQGFQIGIKGGVNISNYTGGDLKTNTLVGFHVGGMLDFMITKAFAIQPEVLFSSQGATYDNGIGGKNNLKVNYINVPVMAKLNFGNLYIEAGPQVGFKASEDTHNGNETINNFAKNLDLSVGAGIGYHSRSGFGIGGRYMAGVSKVGDFDKSYFNKSPDFKNSVIQISVFYTLFNNK